MNCPQCGVESAAEDSVCAECGAPLAPGAAGEVEHPDGPLVEVFRTADASLLPVVESVLMGEGIEFLLHGEEGQALFPLGAMGGGSDQRFLGAVVRVRESDAEKARAVLENVVAGGEEE